MKTSFWFFLLLFFFTSGVALSTGSALFLVFACLILLLLLTGFLSVRGVLRTLEIHSTLDSDRVSRGDDVTLTITVCHHCLLPVSPIGLGISATPDMEPVTVRLQNARGRTQRLSMPFHAAHVGCSTPGVQSITVEDLFGLYRKTRTLQGETGELLVLPGTFEVEDFSFAPGDPGSEIMARATEDVSSPSDFRAYQKGDAMKKIHWKLSARKQELMVRRFEEPVLSDALILMDCSSPPSWGHPEAEADIRDTMLETAASVLSRLMRTDHPVRLPIPGAHPVDIERSAGLPIALETLARVDFSETDRFERVLMLEARRMRKVGSTVIISARLNGRIVDMMIRLHRMGPCLRLYFVTFAPDDPVAAPLVARLMQHDIEVRYVKPVPA